jgi:hypothetical protein
LPMVTEYGQQVLESFKQSAVYLNYMKYIEESITDQCRGYLGYGMGEPGLLERIEYCLNNSIGRIASMPECPYLINLHVRVSPSDVPGIINVIFDEGE